MQTPSSQHPENYQQRCYRGFNRNHDAYFTILHKFPLFQKKSMRCHSLADETRAFQIPPKTSFNFIAHFSNTKAIPPLSRACLPSIWLEIATKSEKGKMAGFDAISFPSGPETDPATVRKIREAIDNQTDVTVQLINYTKSGKKFWNLFHLQPMRDQKGEVQYFIGVQLDGSEHVQSLQNFIPDTKAKEGAIQVKETAENVDEAVRELPDANLTPEDLWINHSKIVLPKPHRKNSSPWKAIQKILQNGDEIGLKHFRPIKPLGSGDTGRSVLTLRIRLSVYY
ncbi:hypothetical protein ACLOJK_001589 [Asimina triloba]